MNRIICDIHNAEQNSRKTVEFLKENSKYFWLREYPIAVIHEKNRFNNAQDITKLEQIEFFNAKNFSKSSYTQKEIDFLKEHVPSAIKTTYALCLTKKQSNTFIFQEKFEHDKWKKVQDDYNFEAFVESSKFNEKHDSKMIENELRDIMRRAKEIPALKAIGFVWVVTLPQTIYIKDILNHYFQENHVFIEKGRKITFIAWGERLADINMRYFVNTP